MYGTGYVKVTWHSIAFKCIRYVGFNFNASKKSDNF